MRRQGGEPLLPPHLTFLDKRPKGFLLRGRRERLVVYIPILY
jgi:hypothetical protein